MKRRLRSVGLFVGFLAVGCSSEPSDLVLPEDLLDSGEALMAQTSPHKAPGDVPGLQIDLPLEPRPWDSDPNALIKVVTETDGKVMIGLKEESSKRALENNGIRGAISRQKFQAGLDYLHRMGAEVTVVFNSFGAVGAVIDPAAAPKILRHELVDFVEPDLPMTVSGKRYLRSHDHAISTPFAQTTPWVCRW